MVDGTALHLDPVDLHTLVRRRGGEVHVGERICHYRSDDALDSLLVTWRQQGIRLVVLGIPEDMGPRANLGQGGADLGWQSFLARFVNLQWQEPSALQSVALLGSVRVSDLQHQAQSLDTDRPEQLQQLRALVDELDHRVEPLLEKLFHAGLVPIVIGGGHNNALPILRAAVRARRLSWPVINCDPHADTRALEGRHSGNPFSYALDQDLLSRYAVLGLNPYKNSRQTLSVFERGSCRFFKLEPGQATDFSAACQGALSWLAEPGTAAGVELDLDAIAGMPSSAMSYWGIALSEACQYLALCARHLSPGWLHLAEGAPACHPAGTHAGERMVGDALCALVLTFVEGTVQSA